MHLLYVIPRYGPQFTSNVTHGELVRELQGLGLAVDVLSFTTRTGAGGTAGWGAGFGTERVYRHVQGATLAERGLGVLSKHGLHYEYFFSMLTGYLHLTRQQAYDLIHIEGTFPLGAVAALAQHYGGVAAPYVITTTGGDLFRLPGEGYGYGHYRLPRLLMSLALRRAAWVRANSRLIGRLAVGYGADPQRITPLPVSIADFWYPATAAELPAYRQACRAQLAAQHGWQPDRPVIGFVGRLISLKAPELLIAALPAIRAQVGPVQVCIVGPSRADPTHGDYLAYLRQSAQQAGVAQWCTFTGGLPPEQVRGYLAAADLLAVPSRLEGLNRVVFEAGAVGTPCVISDGAGAAELVAAYSNGFVVPAGDVPALAHAISRLLGSPRALHECSQRAYALACSCSAAAVARGLVEIYGQALRDQVAGDRG